MTTAPRDEPLHASIGLFFDDTNVCAVALKIGRRLFKVIRLIRVIY
jgi:hypothetical protein